MFTGESYENKFDRLNRRAVVDCIDSNIVLFCKWSEDGGRYTTDPTVKDVLTYTYFCDIDRPTYAKLQELKNIIHERAVVAIARMASS